MIISDEPQTAVVWGFSVNQLGLDVRLIGLSDDVLGTWEEELPDMMIIEDFNKQEEELEICRHL
ncbi:MAG TPA: hypothetical protein VF498_19460, partial [Anaerolineales bacterium]